MWRRCWSARVAAKIGITTRSSQLQCATSTTCSACRAEQTYNLLPTDAHKDKGERFLFPMWRASNQAKFNLHNPPMRNSSSPTRKVGRCSDLLKIILSFLQLGRIPSARCSRSCVRRQAAPSRQIIQLGMVLQFFVDCSVAFAVWSSTRALNIKTSEIIKFCPDFC